MNDSHSQDLDQPDSDAVKMFSFSVWTYKMGEQVAFTIHLGDRLGIYRAMASQGPLTTDMVAERVDCDERFIREWLLGQAAARLIDRHDDGTFELTTVQAAVLADEEDSLAFAAGAFRGGIEPDVIDRIAQSFSTGKGLTYEEQGPSAAAGMARMTGPWSRLGLQRFILPALNGVIPKLESGAKVLDIGCGGGVMLTTIAEAYPNSTCVGYDPSASAIDLANERATEMGLENCSFVVDFGHRIPTGADIDLVLTFDCLHDMPRPDLTASAVRQALAEDGTWLIKDIRSTGDFSKDQRNPLLALFYGFSIASCLQSATSEPDGLGLGTLGLHPERAKELVTDAGFAGFTTLDLEDAANLYYEVTVN